MAHELKVCTSAEDLSNAVHETAVAGRNELLLAKWGAGLLEFADVIFPAVDRADIFAQAQVRESEGRGPHFDVYKSFVDDSHPWLGHYNLLGNAAIKTTILPHDLATSYASRYPTQTDAAFDARRHFSRIAFEEPGADVGKGTLEALTGFVLPVRPDGPHIVHEIVPINPDEPGKFIKLLVAPKQKKVRDDLRGKGYEPLDVLCTEAFGADMHTTLADVSESLTRDVLIPRVPVLTIRPPRRHCNLD